jgi:hypothetical protein
MNKRNKNERQDEASSQNLSQNTSAITGLPQSTGSEIGVAFLRLSCGEKSNIRAFTQILSEFREQNGDDAVIKVLTSSEEENLLHLKKMTYDQYCSAITGSKRVLF